jgi:dTDP-4-dehydrorhamnose reductase
MLKTAIIGASGFVGTHLFNACRAADPATIGTTFSKPDARLTKFDIRTPDLRSLGILDAGIQSIIIASANPNIGYCQDNKDASYAVNVKGTLDLASQAGKLGLQVIFLSSDYVFDGATGGYGDDAHTNPSTEYGRQKEIVEKQLPNLVANHLVLRLSKIYGTQKGDATLIDDFASSLLAGKQLRVATDQIFSPTFVLDLVTAIGLIQNSGETGIFNVCAPEPVSRYNVALETAQALQIREPRLTPIRLHDIPAMAGRPLNTSMKATRLKARFDPTFTPLSQAILKVAQQYMPR